MATITVEVTNGTPSPDPVTIQDNDILIFHNNDANPYLIELWTKNQTCVAIGIFLAASPNGNVKLVPDPNESNATIYYNLLTPGARTNPASGGHGIIVGSGMSARKGEAA